MLKRKLVWKLFFTQTLLILISLTIVGFYITSSLKNYYLSQITSQLESNAILIRNLVKEEIQEGKESRIDILAKELGREIHSRVTVIDLKGVVLGDSEENPQNMKNHRDRPEVKKAMAGKLGTITRYSPTLQKEMMYLAVPVRDNVNRIIGTVRVSLPLDELQDRIGYVYRIIGGGGVLATIIFLGLALIMAKRISAPISQMAGAVRKISEGDFSRRIRVDNRDEIGDLAHSFNRMSEELNKQMENLAREVGEKEAILSSMIEGVIAIDREGRIILLNRAFRNMPGLASDDDLGKFHWEAIRNPEINGFLKEVLESNVQKVMELDMSPLGNRMFRVQAAPIPGKEGDALGVVAVFHDITEIKRLEQARMEFVANVSHELRTPLTSIAGFVETLKEGAIDEKEHARNFLNIIEKHTDRLNRLITDLLDLSRVETGKKKMDLKPMSVTDLIKKVVAGFQEISAYKLKAITVDIPPDLPMVLADEEGIETVLKNLLDNALKYTPEEGEIIITAADKDGSIEIRVDDNGIGIPKEDLPRIFERFYRVDKARSRELGGTGLGLSIVKHIIEAHGGSVTVESEEGKGSEFSIALPGPSF